MVKKITGTRSHIEVEFNDKLIRVEGELTLVEFYATKARMINLTNPETALPGAEKVKAATEILEYDLNQPLKVIED